MPCPPTHSCPVDMFPVVTSTPPASMACPDHTTLSSSSSSTSGFTIPTSPGRGRSRSIDNTHTVRRQEQQGQPALSGGESAELATSATNYGRNATASTHVPIALNLASAASTSGNARREAKPPERTWLNRLLHKRPLRRAKMVRNHQATGARMASRPRAEATPPAQPSRSASQQWTKRQ